MLCPSTHLWMPQSLLRAIYIYLYISNTTVINTTTSKRFCTIVQTSLNQNKAVDVQNRPSNIPTRSTTCGFGCEINRSEFSPRRANPRCKLAPMGSEWMKRSVLTTARSSLMMDVQHWSCFTIARSSRWSDFPFCNWIPSEFSEALANSLLPCWFSVLASF